MAKTIVLILLFSVSIYAQISPGNLTNSHAFLEGMSNCTKCHSLGKQLLKDNCLACHKEIQNRINRNSGYHSNSEVKNQDCWKCHSEHNGRNFEIIHFKKNEFDHSKIKYPLLGSHQNLECSKCHKAEFIKDAELKKRKNTYLGLDQKCAGCHEDFHKNTLGDNCAGCHNMNKFRPAALFDHNKAKYVLTGVHLKTPCEKCHLKETNNGKSFQKFKGIAFKNCSDCHKDVHKGKLGNDCKKCHNTSDFNSINKNSFDHSKTNFVLIGRHENVECTKCHGQKLSSKPKYENCLSCHKDYHKGQLVKNDKITDCKDCHSEKGFSPSLFTIEKHSRTKFGLLGGHLAAPCKSCHLVKSEWNFRIESFLCINCHENIHGKEISPKNLKNNDCGFCHNVTTWNTVTFDHNNTAFKLLGVHRNTECNKCHNKSETNIKRLVFTSLDKDCQTCHKDVHYGQFKEGNKTDCSKCHGFENWKPSKFDHSKTRYPLDGAHKNVDCIKCHKPVSDNSSRKYIIYKIEDIKCAACHLR